MATIVTRAGKGSPLTNAEVDANFTNLNAEITLSRPTIRPSLLLDFANTEALDPRITFARASTARYYNGVTTAKAEENLFLHSQAFNQTNWPVSSATTFSENTTDTTAPDGTSTADKATANAGTATVPRAIQGVTASTQVAFSVFAKQGTYKFLQLLSNSVANGFVNFDLDAGTFNATTATGSITSVGNGWFRCVAIMPAGAPTNFQIGLAASASATRAQSWNPVGTEALYLWGAQLEQRSAVTAYTPTTTQPITNYVSVLLSAANNVARFDHNPITGESLGLLIEEQRTNLILRSEEFDNASWGKTRASITANTIVAPDGTLTGDKLVEDTTATSTHQISQAVTTVASTAYALTVYLKAAERTWAALRIFDGTNYTTFFDLVSGVVGTSSAGNTATIQSVGNGWYRCSVSRITAATSTSAVVLNATGDNASSYTGNGFSGIYIWGAQLEAGAFPTSYIATVASAVTRSADAASMTGANFSSWFSNAEGAVYSEIVKSSSNIGGAWDINAGGTGNSIRLTPNNTTQFYRVATNSTEQTAFDIAASSNGSKAVITYKVNDVAASVNGGAVSVDSSVVLPVVDRLLIGSFNTPGANNLNGTIKKLSYYTRRLTNAELQGLTS